jgi:SWI/SNF-related matrix-associated actin-dependent regulator of chromatin subfamily A member 5
MADLNAKLQKFTGFNLSLSGAEPAADALYDLAAEEDNKDGELNPETRKLLEAAAKDQELAAALADSGRRERKTVDYNTENYYRDKLGGGGKTALLRPTRLPRMQDHQLYNTARLLELHEKEKRFFEKWQGAPNPPKLSGLSDQEQEERDALIHEGFPKWSSLEVRAFTRGCERFGRTAYARIAGDIPTKTELEVGAYAAAFFKLGPERVRDWARVLKAIEAGEAKLQQGVAAQAVISEQLAAYDSAAAAVDRYRYVPKTAQRGRGYEPEDDVQLLWLTKDVAWNDWSAVKDAVHSDTRCGFTFNYFVKSRTAHDLGRRIDLVGKTILRDEERKVQKSEDAAAAAAAAAAGDGGDGAGAGVAGGKGAKKRRAPTAGAGKKAGTVAAGAGADGDVEPAAKRADVATEVAE